MRVFLSVFCCFAVFTAVSRASLSSSNAAQQNDYYKKPDANVELDTLEQDFGNQDVSGMDHDYADSSDKIPVSRRSNRACSSKVDLAFLIDDSGSVGSSNFKKCLNVVKNVVRSFRISSSYVRVSVTVYNSYARRIFPFGYYSSKYQVLRAIDRIWYRGGGTSTGYALNYVRRYVFSGSGSNRKKVLIVMTDGQSGDRVSGPAASLRRMGVTIYALGVGRGYHRGELLQMASSSSHVFTAPFNGLNRVFYSKVVHALRATTCRPAAVCRARIDLAFLIDGSGSVGSSNFKSCLNFVKSVVRLFKISSSYTRVSVTVYNSYAQRIFPFWHYGSKHQVLRAIDRIWYRGGGTRTGNALNYVRRYVFSGSGSNRKKVLIVMTDGQSWDSVSAPAAALKRTGVTIFALGVGRGYKRSELLQMASSYYHVFTSSFSNLKNVVGRIKKKACKARSYTGKRGADRNAVGETKPEVAQDQQMEIPM